MRIKLLVSPTVYSGFHPLLPPIGVAVISNYLRQKGFAVDQDDLDIKVWSDNNRSDQSQKVNIRYFEQKKYVDQFIAGGVSPYIELLSERILAKTKHSGFDLFGFSMLWAGNYVDTATTLSLAKLLKEKYNVPIVSVAFSFDHAKNMMDSGFVDYCVIGPGEEALRLLVQALEGSGSFSGIKGLVYKKDGKVAYNEGSYPNLSKFPDFSGLPMDLYRFSVPKHIDTNVDVRGGKDILVLPYYFSFGCHGNCIFCSQSRSKDFEVKKIDLVVDELKQLTAKYHVNHYYFLNTNVNINYKYAFDLFSAIEKSGLRIFWTDSINFDFLDKALLEKLAANGATRLIYGLESPNPERLRYIQKQLTLKKAVSILKDGHRLGVWNELYLLSGLPFETKEELQNTIEFIKANSECINFIHANKFRLMESELLSHPQKHQIKNVRFIATREERFCDYYSYAFDEIGGLKWEDKVKQSETFFESLNREFRQITIPQGFRYTSSNVFLLFYLKSILANKREIEETYVEIMNEHPEFQ